MSPSHVTPVLADVTRLDLARVRLGTPLLAQVRQQVNAEREELGDAYARASSHTERRRLAGLVLAKSSELRALDRELRARGAR